MPRFTVQPDRCASSTIKGRASWRTGMLANSGWPSDSTPAVSLNFCDAGSRSSNPSKLNV